MSPETVAHDVPILVESERIRNQLVAIETKEREINIARKRMRVENVRADMGYPKLRRLI